MPGGYSEQKSSPKSLVSTDQIGNGQVELRHLAPSLYLEIRNVSLHSHTGTKSRKISYKNLEGDIGASGFYMWSSDATKRYHVTIDSATDLFVLTAV